MLIHYIEGDATLGVRLSHAKKEYKSIVTFGLYCRKRCSIKKSWNHSTTYDENMTIATAQLVFR